MKKELLKKLSSVPSAPAPLFDPFWPAWRAPMASGWAPPIHAAKKSPALAFEHNVEKVCTDLTDLMHDSEVNFIYIASPNNLHFPKLIWLCPMANMSCAKNR